MKIGSAGIELLHAEEQADTLVEEWTDGTTDITRLIVGFRNFNNSAFCPHSVFMCFVWI